MYELTDKQIELKKNIRAFVDAEVAPLIAELDASGEYPAQTVRRIYEEGFGTLPFPPSFGGDGLGLNNSPTGNVKFENCQLPPDALIGLENEGYKPIKDALNLGRLGLSAIAIGLAQSAFEKSVAFSCNRGDYDRSIFSYQGVSFPIAEMYTNITMARNTLYHVAAITQAGRSATMETAALKLFASEMCQKVCQDAILIHGGSGYRSHCDVERMLRDAQLLTASEGTSQICKVAIANRIHYMGSQGEEFIRQIM